MKKKLLYSIILVSLPFALLGQFWEAKDAGFHHSVRGGSIYATNESVAWTYGWEQDSAGVETDLNYEISKSIDAGMTWHSVTVPFENKGYLSSMWALDDRVAWITYFDYTIGNLVYKTTNGGDSWEVFFDGIYVFVDFVYMWNEQEGLVFGDPDSLGFEIYTTQDGGVTWNRSSNVPFAPTEEYIYADNYGVKGNRIWVATSKGRIYYSPDQGISWEAWDAPATSFYPWHMDVNDDGDVFLVCLKNDTMTGVVIENRLFRTKNEGLFWENITAADHNILINDLEAVPGSGVLVGVFVRPESLEIIRTRISYDDGESWIEVDTQSLINYMDFYNVEIGYASENNFYFNPDSTNVYRYAGTPLTSLIKKSPLQDVEVSISPNPTPGVIFISLTTDAESDYWILLNDLSGKLIYKNELSNVSDIQETIDLESLPAGTYMITIANTTGVMSEKVLKF